MARARAAILPYLREQLPLYKLPSGLVVMDQLPMTSSGKVDRQQLPSQAPGELIEQAIVEPRDALESYLADCWCDTLGLETVSISRNFFDVGGTSLQAALLTTRLTDDLGVDVPTALLFDLADIAHLGAKLRELHPQPMLERFGEVHHQESGANADCSPSASAVHTLLAPLKPSGSRTPIFLIHPPGGIVVCYHELAQQLTGDQPLFAIRSRGLHGEETQHETMESMAADYVEAILSAQSHGPFIVGGWSLGGLIAYEIAQQLLQCGETLERLILLDTTIPQGSTDLVPESEQVNVGKEYGIELTLDQLGELPAEEQLPFLWEHAKKLGVVDDHTAPEVVAKSLAELQGLFHHHVTVAKQYQLKVLPVKVDLFRPSETPFEQEISNDRGWRHLVSDVRVHFVPGHHHSMVQMPHVVELAKRISSSAH